MLQGLTKKVRFNIYGRLCIQPQLQQILIQERNPGELRLWVQTITLTVTNGSDFSQQAVAANTSIELLTRDLILQEGELKATAATPDRLHIVAIILFAIHRTPQ